MGNVASPYSSSAPNGSITILFVTDIQLCPIVGGQILHAYNMLDLLSRRYAVVMIAPAIDPACGHVSLWGA